MSALPIARPDQAQRFNFDPALSCPLCFRGAGALSRPAVDAGHYRCGGCSARFRFLPANDADVATLERVPADTPENAGARMADDWRCPGCDARGFIVFCGSCTQDLYGGGARR